jgi:carbon monoxide dehydrogenase subunit G
MIVKITLLSGLALLALLMIYAATRPDSFAVERSARVEASPERVFGLINDLHRFNTWNPYERKDPAIKGQYGTTASGPGASYAWQSDKVGIGSMQIVDSTPASRVAMKLDFIKPFEAHNTVEVTLMPEPGATRVTWAMVGPMSFVGKLMHVFFNMEQMVGKDFEEGLGTLKSLAEQR